MITHQDKKILPFNAEDMYALVADIEKYPEFLPWCRAARIRKDENINDKRQVEADLVISFGAFREKFGSKVVMDPAVLKIDVEYLDGPFRKLVNQWSFVQLDGQQCEVNFFVEFEFKSRILQIAIGQVFEHAMLRIVSAFEKRAAELYG